MKQFVPLLTAMALTGCASSTLYYPPVLADNGNGIVEQRSPKAIQLYGDSLGSTRILVTRNSVEYSAAGGNDNSSTTGILTREAGSVARFGISWGFMYGILKSLFTAGGNAYQAHLDANPATPSAPAPLPSVGATIPAQTSATLVPVP